jgi:hypothetical protein
MDTRYWGPSGWKFLHLVTFGYEQKEKTKYKQFFELLPYVLPCKFCRSSLVSHYEKLPVSEALDSKESLTRWMWKIHGQVNQKLRDQRQKIPEDPSFALVKKLYEERIGYGCTQTEFPGWEFLFSIIENHPLAKGDTSTPIPGAPPIESLDGSDLELLKWNYLSGEKRFGYICKFWTLLPSVMPFQEWKHIWKRNSFEFCDEQSLSKKKLWAIRCAIESELDLLNRTNYRELCSDLRQYKSGCSKNKRARTCRKKKKIA